MDKIVGIIVVFLVVISLTLAFSPPVYVYEEVVVTHYRHKTFYEGSVTTVKFLDGDIRICKHLPYRDRGEIIRARKVGRKSWVGKD